jgi:hypothetical protein
MKRVALGTVQRGEIATIPAAALDPPHRAASPAVPALYVFDCASESVRPIPEKPSPGGSPRSSPCMQPPASTSSKAAAAASVTPGSNLFFPSMLNLRLYDR